MWRLPNHGRRPYEAEDDWHAITGSGYDDGGQWMVCPEVSTSFGSDDAQLIAAAVNALPDLLGAAEALERVRVLAEDWRYKGECGWGPWQAGEGPDPEGAALDWAASKIRRAIDGEPHDLGD